MTLPTSVRVWFTSVVIANQILFTAGPAVASELASEGPPPDATATENVSSPEPAPEAAAPVEEPAPSEATSASDAESAGDTQTVADAVAEAGADAVPADEPAPAEAEPVVAEAVVAEPGVPTVGDTAAAETAASSSEPAPAPQLSTDKSDYAPTELVTIFGSFFKKLYTLVLKIVGYSAENGNSNHEASVTTDDNGAFTYQYQLDGTYRPDYTVEATDPASGETLAKTTFTDGNPAATLEQCHNRSGANYADCRDLSANTNTWGSGNANGGNNGNALLHEGDSQNYRLILTDMVTNPSTPVTITIGQQYTKGGKMAYDFPTGPGNLGTATPFGLEGIFPCDSHDNKFPSGYCTHGSQQLLQISPIPDSTLPAGASAVEDLTQAAQSAFYSAGGPFSPTRNSNNLYVYGADTTGPTNGFGVGLSNPYSFTGSAANVATGDSELRWSFTITPTSPTVVIAWGAHISKGENYDGKGTAVDITGSPYHTILRGFSAGNAGNQDMQMAASAIVQTGTIVIVKESVSGTGTFNYTATGDGMSNFSINTATTNPNSQTFTSLIAGTNGGSRTITETVPSGWSLATPTCQSANSNSTFSTSATAVTVSNLGAGDTVTCTFTNTLQQGSLQLVKRVVNDNGGAATVSAFGLVSSAGSLTFGAGVADGANTLKYSSQVITVNAGNYTFSENDVTGYTEGTWSCTGASATGTAYNAGSVTVPAGVAVVCTITNDDQAAHLIVIKHVINDNGGTAAAGDFTMTIGGVTAVGGNSFAGAEAPGVDKTLASVGAYTVTESAVTGYQQTSASSDCSGTIALGETKTCTITNDDVAPLMVSKTATTTFTRTFGWTIDKSVTPDTLNMFVGDIGSADYTVAVTKDSGTDSAWAVSGTITIHNPANIAANVTGVTDSMTGGLNSTVNCPGSFPQSLAAGADLVCTYSRSLPDGTSRINTATVTTTGDVGGGSGTANVTFGAPTTVVNDSVTVSDTNGSSWPFSTSGQQQYSRNFVCGAGIGQYTGTGNVVGNTATIQETGPNDSASVTVNCYGLEVSKTADTSFDRSWNWTINKTGDATNLNLAPDQTYTVNYTVSVNATKTDGNYAVGGSISVHNPAPIAATLTSVSDAISGFGAAGVACNVSFPYTLAAGDTLNCIYAVGLNDGASRTNTATATLQNSPSGTTNFTGSAAVTFSATPTNEYDECVDVTDTYAGSLGTACASETLPKTFTYSRDISFSDQYCGQTPTVDNTATFTTNDTQTTGSDSHTVNVSIVCTCTLTQGYWKTHNASFKGGAPADPNWFTTFTPSGENTLFFSTGQTWFQIFWTAPKGNAYYQLAHQYMAAELNILSGASAPESVTAAITDAKEFFSMYTPANWPKNLKNTVLSNAGVLGSYNEGLIGPGHCSEQNPS